MPKEKKVKEEKEVNKEVGEEKVEQDVIIHHEDELRYEYSSKFLEDIEHSRLAFNKKFKKNNYFKWIVSAIAIGILIFAFLGVPNIVPKGEGNSNNPLQIALMVSLAVISLGIMFGYSIFTKKMINKKAKEYFAELYSNITSFVFEDEGYKDVVCDSQKRIEKIQFDENCLFKDVFDVGSRATTEFTYEDIPVMLCDCAAQIKTDKRAKPVFVGKYVIAPANYESDEIIAIYVKGDKRSLPPTNLDELKCVLDNEQIAIYSNSSSWNKVVTSKVKNLILAISKGKSLVDISISIRSGKCFVCLGYDDDLMVLPLEQPFNPKPTEEYKEELLRVMSLIKELNK